MASNLSKVIILIATIRQLSRLLFINESKDCTYSSIPTGQFQGVGHSHQIRQQCRPLNAVMHFPPKQNWNSLCQSLVETTCNNSVYVYIEPTKHDGKVE